MSVFLGCLSCQQKSCKRFFYLNRLLFNQTHAERQIRKLVRKKRKKKTTLLIKV
uniref:Uncharacterized protein n=1 Tax=Rhizophora mucronata TaxID=61149 RepID=A0A2P2NJ77_RHIMU